MPHKLLVNADSRVCSSGGSDGTRTRNNQIDSLGL
jgi:hypothetical protein